MEDRSKSYLSYPKPSYLDVTSANRNINVVEWVNIPKCKALDDLVTPLRLLELFYMKLYSRESRH